jgi:hypothetical protein
MKGFEVTFRGKTTTVALNENILVHIQIEKGDDNLRFSFNGLMTDTDLSYVWDYAEDLQTGDEIIIKQKEIEKNSEPLHVRKLFESMHGDEDIETQSPELITAEILKMKLDRFYILENKLKEAGLI